jgi:hypothetical protein
MSCSFLPKHLFTLANQNGNWGNSVFESLRVLAPTMVKTRNFETIGQCSPFSTLASVQARFGLLNGSKKVENIQQRVFASASISGTLGSSGGNACDCDADEWATRRNILTSGAVSASSRYP